MKKISFLTLCFQFIVVLCAFTQKKPTPQITLSNSIQYSDTSFTDLPGNGFLIDIGNEILAVTCKHTLWVNRSKGMTAIDFKGKLKEWKMIVHNDPSQYVILGDIINANSNEAIGERNTDRDYLVFKVKKNHSKITPIKLSPKPIPIGDTLYQVGLSYKIKKSNPKSFATIVKGYSGSSILTNFIVQDNYAGLSGSPVININNELVAIVSSWKFDIDTKSWFNAPCSIDYLLTVLYSYWLEKNKKTKSINSFQEYLAHYKSLNGYIPEVSSYLYIELFYADWLKSNGFKYGTFECFSKWTTDVMKANGIKIITDNYRKSLLIFDSWKEAYSNGKMNINDLEKMLEVEKSSVPNFINFCEYSKELSDIGEHDKAIALLLYADEKIQHMGQLYAFLGDAYFAKGEHDLAKNAYFKCLKTYPEYPQAIDGLAKLR